MVRKTEINAILSPVKKILQILIKEIQIQIFFIKEIRCHY